MINQTSLIPDAEHKNILLYIEHDNSVDRWIAEHHYLQSVPVGAIIRMCFKDAEHRVLGCMLWGHPTARKLDQHSIMELTRMCFINDTEPFAESKCLGMARKHIRKHHGAIKGLIAYSSTGAGHEGTIYKADNWYMLGESKSASWETRLGRVNRDLSVKIRWTRSP
jgi:hypothetical protein